jgi:hypothetical protein
VREYNGSDLSFYLGPMGAPGGVLPRPKRLDVRTNGFYKEELLNEKQAVVIQEVSIEQVA